MNRWTIDSRNRFAAWSANLHAVRNDLSALRWWRTGVVEAGERTEVFVVQRAPQVGFVQGRDDDLPTVLLRADAIRETADLFSFSRAPFRVVNGEKFEATSRITLYDRAGQLIDGPVADLSVVLESTRPDLVARDGHWFNRCLPLEIAGLQFDPADPGRQILEVSFFFRTDLWFPWISAYRDGPPMGERMTRAMMWDNRALAVRHTPRLNQFLSIVADLTETLGAQWQLDIENCYGTHMFMLGDRGIDITAPLPTNITELVLG